jgi:branched-chain amino acid transport system substrate-binding protein
MTNMANTILIRQILKWLLILSAVAAWSADTTAYADQNIKIAVIVAQSGKAEAYGRAVIQGAQVAVNEINQAEGVLKRQLSLIILDNQSTALHSRQAAIQAVYHKVQGVVGAVWSTHSLAAAPVLQKNQIPMVSPGSTAPDVTKTGDYIFRTCYTDDFQGELLADFAFNAIGHRQAAVLTNISETYSQILAKYFSVHFAGNGGKVIYEEGYKGSAIDFYQILDPLRLLNPDLVFIPGYSRDSGLIIKQARIMKIEAVFLGGDAWETSVKDYAREALQGAYFSTHWHPRSPYEQSRKFITRFRAAFGDIPISAYAPLAYDAVWLFADAIGRAKSINKVKIRNALANTRKFMGATGKISFNAYGDPIKKGASILKFEDGHWRFFKAFEPK